MKKINFNRWNKLAWGLLALGLAACNGGGGGGIYYPAWYDVNGHYCGRTPGPGCNFYRDGIKIGQTEDPYYITNFFFYSDPQLWSYYDSWGEYKEYYGRAWMSPSGILYNDFGRALNEEGSEASDDLVGDYDQAERNQIEAAGRTYAENHALSEDKGIMIAETLNAYAKLGKDGGRTTADIRAVTRTLLGVNPDRAVAAFGQAKAGDVSALTQLNEQVATHWGTRPDTAKQILKGWFKREAQALGTKI